MSKLRDLKLKDVEVLNDMNLMSSSSNDEDGSGMDGGTLPEVVVYGTRIDSGSGADAGIAGGIAGGSGSSNSERTCSKCKSKLDGGGHCPNCDYGSGSGPMSESDIFYAQSKRWEYQRQQCKNLPYGASCSYPRGNGIVNGTCKDVFYAGDKMCTDKVPKTEVCVGLRRGMICASLYEGREISGVCGGSYLDQLHCVQNRNV